MILWAASPLTPFVPDFDKLPDTTRVLAADGSELAALSGENGRAPGPRARRHPRARRDHVLRAMARHGWLPRTDLDAALAEPMNLAPPQPPGVSRRRTSSISSSGRPAASRNSATIPRPGAPGC
jgi:membrane peptidoglycan carboxypeptidase